MALVQILESKWYPWHENKLVCVTWRGTNHVTSDYSVAILRLFEAFFAFWQRENWDEKEKCFKRARKPKAWNAWYAGYPDRSSRASDSDK